MRRNAIIALLFVFAFCARQERAWAQGTPKIVWQKCHGGTRADEANSIIHTTDGGFAVAGLTNSFDDEVVGHHGGEDGWVVKLNAVGDTEWEICLGGSGTDLLNSITQTSDGGYVVAGETFSSGLPRYHTGGDAYVVKLDGSGNVQWQYCYGGSLEDWFNSIVQTADGGFVAAGGTNSNDNGDVTGYHGTSGSDCWVVKISSTGTIQWEKCRGGSGNDVTKSIIKTTDGGFALAGTTNSYDGDVAGSLGSNDVWIIKLDDTGALLWQYPIGGTLSDSGWSIIQTSDGGYAVAGQTRSTNDYVSGNHGGDDFWIVKLDATAGYQWSKCLGGSGDDFAQSVIQTADGGFAVAGYTLSHDGQVTRNYGNGPGDGNEWVVKLNDTGAIQWQKSLGGTVFDQANSIIQIPNGNYVVAGYASSDDSDVTNNHGGEDMWIVELAPPDPPVISYITPDAGAPGMCVAVEIIGPANSSDNFGDDQLYSDESIVSYARPSDSALAKLGPTIVGWNGRSIQQMFLIEPHNGPIDTEIYFQVTWQGNTSTPDSFRIVSPTHIGTLTGGGTIPTTGRTKRNTMVVDSLILTGGTYTCPQSDPDPRTAGNQAYLPLRILSNGPIRLSNATLSADGYAGTSGTSGGAGGPGGGGGGGGYPAKGGDGFTGGGGDNDNATGPGGNGSGSTTGSSNWFGGGSIDGITGGTGEQHSSSGGDDGAGGGTGHPFGSSGVSSGNSSSPAGGYGAGSAGGSTANYLTNYGGGGGGNDSVGTPGQGTGNNGGQIVGNPMVVPLFGGSGGGAGNQTYISFLGSSKGGCGGGGGGAIELTSFASFTEQSSHLTAQGGAGSNAVSFESAAGGGGGSGGAVSVSARDSVSIDLASNISVNGGAAGTSSNSNSNGGKGSVGRVRINGFVSKTASPSSANYYAATHGYTGPSIQRVTYTTDSFYVQGYAEYWDGVPGSQIPVVVFYTWPSLGTWLSANASLVSDPASHTARWSFGDTLSISPTDTELYLVAVQDVDPVSGTFTDFPPGFMSHTSGLIAKVTGPPQALVKPTTLDFGDVLVGQCVDTTIEVYSTGKSALSVDSTVILGTDASQFKILTPLPKSLSPGDSLSVTISFCPNAPKCPMNATLRVFTAVGSRDVALTGCGVQPQMVIHPLVLDFGRIHIGACKDSFVMVSNPGKDPLTISNEFVGGPQFKVLDPLPIIVPAGDSTKLHLEYCPTDTIVTLGYDSVHGNAPQSPVTVILMGEGQIGILSMPKVIDFGDVREGNCKDSIIYVVNTGNDSLLIESNLISPSGFTFTLLPLPVELLPNDSIPIDIRFCSTDTGNFSAMLTLGTDVPSADTALLLAHTGIGVLQLDSVIDFGSVATGGCADTIVSVKNVGTDTLMLTPGANFLPPFSYQSSSPLELAPGESALITLRFCPQDTNEATETTHFDTIGSGVNRIFTLRGKGVEGSLATSGAIDLGCVALGTSVTRTDTIRNLGAAALQNLLAAITPGGSANIVHNPPPTLAPGAIDSVVIIIPATTLGAYSATLTLSWTNGTPVTVPITAEISVPPAITSLDNTLNFDSTNVGDSSIIECVRFANYSCIPLPLDQIFVSSGVTGEFEIVSNTATSSIADSAIATICIRYKPHQGGSSTGTLVVTSAGDTIALSKLSGFGIGKSVGVELAIDTVAGRPGDIVNLPVRTLNNVSSAAISSLTFRVTFNPMQLDLKAPIPPVVPSIESSTAPTYSVKTYSIGDKEITASFPTALKGTPVVAELPFEILLPTANTASVHLMSASFGASLATLATASNGLVQIEQCDTNDRVALVPTPIDVAQSNPNPVAGRASITVTIRDAGHLTLEVYNALGSKVMVPFDNDVAAGTQTIEIDAGTLASGAYRYITTWTATGSDAQSYQLPVTRIEKTMIVLGE